MATTRTPGITVNTDGFRTINKEYRGERIFARLGTVCQEQAERRLSEEMERLSLARRFFWKFGGRCNQISSLVPSSITRSVGILK